ncbi:DUF3696 domain-containing protein [Thalassospira sp. A3_1]|uniref:DUF3696 domain-containing protein n=1 Tax=Thalassospira sp. A3_1 TaxID=2821088 RepID=UPI001ADB3860|nr:DUF3696 domain-containing protein [Thalassospira sp. A3_1]MBO9508353.1 AAA family ATPase [Thalassospira sp. A3_1]
MLARLTLENFKAFKELQTFDLAPLTLIYGPNSAGKSSIIQSLALLRQTLGQKAIFSDRLNFRGDLVDLGSYRSIVHNHDKKNRIRISIDYTVKERSVTPLSSMPRELPRGLDLFFKSAKGIGSRKFNSSQLDEVRYRLDQGRLLNVSLIETIPDKSHRVFDAYKEGMRFFNWKTKDDLNAYCSLVDALWERRIKRPASYRSHQLQLSLLDQQSASFPEATKETLELLKGAIFHTRGLLPFQMDADEEFLNYNAMLAPKYRRSPVWQFHLEFIREISKISYLGPIRSHPERQYILTEDLPDQVGPKGENTAKILLRQQSTLTNELDAWLSRFEINYRTKIRHVGNELTGEIVSVNLIDTNSGVELTPLDVGFGIGQVLPILVEGLSSKRKTICVEQPEIHLHPRLQGHLADFFLETAYHPRTNPEGVQWVIETHSESLMLRLQRRIRERKSSNPIPLEDISVIYVDRTNRDNSRATQIRIDKDGDFIDEWPNGFFEERFLESFL